VFLDHKSPNMAQPACNLAWQQQIDRQTNTKTGWSSNNSGLAVTANYQVNAIIA